MSKNNSSLLTDRFSTGASVGQFMMILSVLLIENTVKYNTLVKKKCTEVSVKLNVWQLYSTVG